MGRDIDVLNEEMIAAGIRVFVGGLHSVREHPQTLRLIEEISATDGLDPALDSLYEEAIRDTVKRFEVTGLAV